MTDIHQFLAARLDKAEAAAHAAAQSTASTAAAEDGGEAPRWSTVAGTKLWSDPDGRMFGETGHPASAAHIVYWDPARVLADIAAKRAILASLAVSRSDIEGALAKLPDDAPIEVSAALISTLGMIGVTEKRLADPFADHTDHEPAWKLDA
jgi:hypothetical protein